MSRCETLSDADIHELALQVLAGNVYFDNQVPQNLLMNIFMPLAFMEKDHVPENCHRMYGRVADAGPRSINGYPIFTKLTFLNLESCEKLKAKIDELKVPKEA